MIAILSQDRKNILNADSVERIYVDGNTIYAKTLTGTVTELGTYEKTENIAKVMLYIGFASAAAKDGGKLVVVPSEETVGNEKEIAAKALAAMCKDGTVDVKIAPELKAYLDKMKGGEGK
ncbi:MAG: hypothetical protein IJX94_01175 [Clostridia bacterium]|nr:hypothetical protein [Clostridia bacterium]